MPAIYNADCYCDSCADNIRARILADYNARGEELPAKYADEEQYDSDEYPKYMPENEESDSPQHCGEHEKCLEAITLPSSRKIGALLSDTLTSEGARYVANAVLEGGEVADLWAEHFRDYDEIKRAAHLTYSYGMTPPALIRKRLLSMCPNGYKIEAHASSADFQTIAAIINQGIDARLEGVTGLQQFEGEYGKRGLRFSADDMLVILRRLAESDHETAIDLRYSILDTLNIEEV